jgi:hypothetical protein
MAGPKEKKVTKRISNTTSKVSSPAKESTQRSRSKQDGPSKTKTTSRGKASGSVGRGTSGGPTGRGTEISNKTLEDRTKRDLKSTLKARKSDEKDAVKKKALKKAGTKKIVKSIAKKIPLVGAAISIAEKLPKIRKPINRGKPSKSKSTAKSNSKNKKK